MRLTRIASTRVAGSALLLLAVGTGVLPAVSMQTRLHGSIVGYVSDSSGAAQMGATVLLVNRQDRIMLRAMTNERGAFGFDYLPPDSYTVRVSQTSFAPARKANIQVAPGGRSFLSIQLATLLSSIELFYAAPGTSTLMSEDWKWVLRTASSTRPVLRALPVPVPANAAVFSETRGLLKVSAGESAGSSQFAAQADLGTAFALATSLFGDNLLLFSGNVGFSPANGVPASGFRTSFKRSEESEEGLDFLNPEVKLTVRQLSLPSQAARAQVPMLRSMSMGIADTARIGESIQIEFGASVDQVNFLERLRYLSPYGVLTLDGKDAGAIEFAYSSGLPPGEFSRAQDNTFRDDANADLHRDVSALAMFPRLSLRNGHLRMQRAQNYEIAYRRTVGRTAVGAGIYRERLSDAALTLSAPGGFDLDSDILPDINSQSGIFNIGGMTRTGLTASLSQPVWDWMKLELVVSRGGVLRTEQRNLSTGNPDEIRALVRRSQQNAVSMRISGIVPVAQTRFSTSYQWTDYRSLTPGHMFLTRLSSPDAGLNVSLRQPIPALPFFGAKMEIMAEARNSLAQGYLPITTVDGRRVLLIHTPRSLRGGISFFF